MSLIDERAKTHGDYEQVAVLIEMLQKITATARPETSVQMHSRRMICVKLARIALGDCYFEDHWRDIAGYATLAADYLAKQREEAAP